MQNVLYSFSAFPDKLRLSLKISLVSGAFSVAIAGTILVIPLCEHTPQIILLFYGKALCISHNCITGIFYTLGYDHRHSQINKNNLR